MFNQRVGSQAHLRVSTQSPGGASNYDTGNVPKSNFFGGTFQKSQSPSMMQTKTNEQKMRVIQSNKKLSVAPAIMTEQSSMLGLSKASPMHHKPFASSTNAPRQMSTTHNGFGGDYHVAP